jgi:hypothetical protein
MFFSATNTEGAHTHAMCVLGLERARSARANACAVGAEYQNWERAQFSGMVWISIWFEGVEAGWDWG